MALSKNDRVSVYYNSDAEALSHEALLHTDVNTLHMFTVYSQSIRVLSITAQILFSSTEIIFDLHITS